MVADIDLVDIVEDQRLVEGDIFQMEVEGYRSHLEDIVSIVVDVAVIVAAVAAELATVIDVLVGKSMHLDRCCHEVAFR